MSEQILRTLDTVYRLQRDSGEPFLPRGTKNEERRKAIIKGASELKIRWSVERNQYTFRDGSVLPKVKPKCYRRAIWKPDVPEQRVILILQRTDESLVQIVFAQRFSGGVTSPAGVLRLRDADNNPLRSFNLVTRKSGESGTHTSVLTMNLREGARVKVELRVGDKLTPGPMLTP